MEWAIQCRGVSFKYGFRGHALDDLSLNVPKGSIYGLLGPNGCGKSTLMRLMIGLAPASRGQIEVLALDPHRSAVEVRSRVGFVPQEDDFDPKLTTTENLKLFAAAYGPKWNAARARKLMAEMELPMPETPAKRFGGAEAVSIYQVRRLSKGQRQRLSLVTALAVEPEILMLDEPAASLDSVNRQYFSRAVIDFMAESENRTVVISSHLLSELEGLVDHVALIYPGARGGSLLVEAPLVELKEKVLLAEIPDDPLPDALTRHPDLLSISRRPPYSLVFWADRASSRGEIESLVEQTGGRLETRHSLDEIFVRAFRDSRRVGSAGSPKGGGPHE